MLNTDQEDAAFENMVKSDLHDEEILDKPVNQMESK